MQSEKRSPLRRLRDIAEARRKLDEEQLVLISQARATSCTWGQIGAALGTSKQAARRWYLRRSNERPDYLAAIAINMAIENADSIGRTFF